MSIQINMNKGMKDDYCGNYKSSVEGRRTNRKANWVEGWWENIGPEPIYIRDKYHLKEVCKKYNVIPKAFAKPKSQGKGMEWDF